MKYSRSFSKDFPPIFRNVEVWLVQKFQINFSIFTHFMRNFGSMSYNGKSIGEVAENRSGKFRFSRNVANAFCQWLNYKKSQCKKHWRDRSTKLMLALNPPLRKTDVVGSFYCGISSTSISFPALSK